MNRSWVFQDDEFAHILGFLQYIVKTLRVISCDHDYVHGWILIECMESRNLVLYLALRIVDFQRDAELLGCFVKGCVIGGTPCTFRAGLDKANHQVCVLAIGRTFDSRDDVAAGGRQRNLNRSCCSNYRRSCFRHSGRSGSTTTCAPDSYRQCDGDIKQSLHGFHLFLLFFQHDLSWGWTKHIPG